MEYLLVLAQVGAFSLSVILFLSARNTSMHEPHLTTPLAACICASVTLKEVWQYGH